MPRRWAEALLLALALASPALAQPSQPGVLTGAWRLETAPHRETGCVIRGTATVAPVGADRYDVLIKVAETCPSNITYRATERCAASADGGRVQMSCVVLSMGQRGYLADTFSLEWRGQDVLVGRLADSGQWNEPVTWRRAGPALTS